MFQRSGHYLKWIGAVSLFAGLITTAPGAQEQTLTGKSAFGTWRDDNPGRRRLIRPEDLPAISASVNSASRDCATAGEFHTACAGRLLGRTRDG
jgi:hypothetical protein